MGRRRRECYLCGQEYNYCPTCSQDKTKPAWMSEFHTESCKNIFDICTRFNMDMMSKEEAKAALSTCDLANQSNFKSYVQRDIANIMAEPEAPKKRIRKIEPVIQEPIEDTSHEVVTIENE